MTNDFDPRPFETSVSQRSLSVKPTPASMMGSQALRHLIGYPDAETLDYHTEALIRQVALAARISCDVAVQALLEYGLVDMCDLDEYTTCTMSAITEQLQIQFGERKRQKGRPSSQDSRNTLICDLIAKEVYKAFQLPATAEVPIVEDDEYSPPSQLEIELAKQLRSLRTGNSFAIILLLGILLILSVTLGTAAAPLALGPDLRNIIHFTGMCFRGYN